MGEWVEVTLDGDLVELNGTRLNVYGSVCVLYSSFDASPSVGERGGVEVHGIIDTSYLQCDGTDLDYYLPQAELRYEPSHPLIKAIEARYTDYFVERAKRAEYGEA